jgi:uncharacterized membrane protein
MPRWFLILNGVALLLMGVVMLSARLRERPFHRAMFGMVWALLCCAMGTALLLMATGYLEQPGMTKTPLPAGKRVPEFPTGK